MVSFERKCLNSIMALERQSRIINQGFFLSPLLNAKYDYDDGVVKGLLHNKYWVTKT